MTNSARQLPDESTAGERARQLDRDGFVVIPDVLAPDECADWISLLERAYRHDHVTLPPHPAGEEEGVQFVRAPLRHSTVFERALTHPAVLDTVKATLGPEVRLYLMNARKSEPGHGGQPLHDLTRRRGRPFEVCNVVLCLDAFTAVNGATRVLPGSHLDDTRALARMSDPQEPHPDQVTVEAFPGSAILFHAGIIHSGTRNDSSAPRASLQYTYTVEAVMPFYPWYRLPAEIKARLGPESAELLRLGDGAYEAAGRWS